MRGAFYIITLSLVVTVTFGTLSAQQNGNIDFERLNDDLSIMEGILDKLIGSVISDYWPSTSQVQGFYVPEYGIIFSVPIAKSAFEPIFRIPPLPNLPKANDFSFSFQMNTFDGTKNKKQEKEVLERISPKVHSFLGIYADAIGQLKPKDKISVYIYDNTSRSPIQLYTVAKSHISDLRSGKISEEKFYSKILLTSLEDKNEMRAQIDILAYVLDSAVRTQSENTRTIGYSGQGVSGFYLNGFGALFLIKSPYDQYGESYILLESDFIDFSSSQIEIFEEVSAETNRKRIKERKKELMRQKEIYINKMKNYKLSFSKLLGNYGNTLRLVKNDEWVIVSTNWHSPNNVSRSGIKQNSLIMRVRKRDLADYSKGKISNEVFFKKIKYTEY